MAKLGADVARLDDLADCLTDEGTRLGGVATSTAGLLATTWWLGPDADRLRDWWRDTAERQLRDADGWLARLGDQLRRQADEQLTASGVTMPIRPVAMPVVLRCGLDWLQDRAAAAGDWLDERGAEWQRFVDDWGDGWEDVANGEEDDEQDGGLPWLRHHGPLDDIVRDGAEAAVDRGSTLADYAVRTVDRRLEHPVQTLVDHVTLTAHAEDLAAVVQIAGGDAEIVDHGYGNDAVVLNGAWAPFAGGAITIGHTVSYNDTDVPSHDLVQHEMQHVYDLEDVGGTGFYGSYALDYAWNYVVEGRRGDQEAYRDIFWEQRGYHAGDADTHGEPEGILGGLWKDLW